MHFGRRECLGEVWIFKCHGWIFGWAGTLASPGSDRSMQVDEPPGWGLDRWVLYTDLVGSTVANCMMRRSLSFPEPSIAQLKFTKKTLGTVSAVDHKWLQWGPKTIGWWRMLRSVKFWWVPRRVVIFLRPLLPKLQEVNMKRLAQDSGLQNNRQFCADLELA